jgi:hypothetical protein
MLKIFSERPLSAFSALINPYQGSHIMQFSIVLSKITSFSIGIVISASLILAGCGGGGGGSSTPAPSSLGGVAAVGYPIVGGAVQVKCAAGAALTTTTSSTGAWQVTLNGQTLPCAVEVSGGTKNNIANTTSYHSIAISAGIVNVTPFTDLMVANLTAQNPSTWFTGLTPALLTALTQSNVNTALANLRTALSGLTALATINPITTSFSAVPGNTMDDLLAALQLAMSNTSSSYASLLSAASSNSFATVVAALNAALPAAYTSVTAGVPTGSNPGITGVLPASAAVGASVTISGTNFRQGSGGITSGDAYRVSFNGTTATPYLRTLTQLAVIVPVGATTGTLTATDLITNLVYTVPSGFTVTGTTGNAISATATTTAQNLTIGTAMASFSPLTPSGGATPYTYSNTGTLPSGLLFSTSTGAVTGTPTATYATANLVFSVKDANNVVASTTSTVSFTVNAVSVATSNLNDTGITANQCYQVGSNVLVACNSAAAIAQNNVQDGMVGRDANIATNSNTDGKLGFSFTSITGGCVQDNVTGLMWEVKTTDGGLRDWTKTYTNYSAAYNPSNLLNTSTDAGGFVTAVNATNLCGYNDWRMPDVDELQSIVDYGAAYPGPAIDATWFPNTQSGTNSVFWSASPDVSSSILAWFVGFGDGFVYYNPRSSSHYVRLVRAGQTHVTPRYTASTDGQEVTDNQTKLIWRRCAEGMVFNGSTCTGAASTFTHEAALQRAAAQAGSTGIAWRLPNVKELSSITDKSYSNPSIDLTAFLATPVGSFWSASPYVGNASISWLVVFDYGGTFGNARDGYYVRLVRAGQ